MPNFHKKIEIPRVIKIQLGEDTKIIKFEDTDPMFYLQACFNAGLFEVTEDESTKEDDVAVISKIKRKS